MMWSSMHVIRRSIVPISIGNAFRGMKTEGLPFLSSRFQNKILLFSAASTSVETHQLNYTSSTVFKQNLLSNSVHCQCSCRWYSQSAGKAVPEHKGGHDNVEVSGDDKGQQTKEEVTSEDQNHDFEEEEEGISLTEDEIQYLTNGDEELIKRVKYIQLEHDVLRQEGEQVPSTIKMKHWEELIMLETRSKRKKFYSFLFKIEMANLNAIRKKMEKREKRLKEYAENPIPPKEEDPYGTFYALSRNCLHLRLYDTTINKFLNSRVCSAMVHHPPLILDCSYDQHMSPRESKNCAKQIEYVIAENRNHIEPFNMTLCNAGRETRTMKYLRRMVPILDDDHFIINVQEGCFTDLYPKDRLVYLSPHTRDEMLEYNEDDIYIIGAMVDKTNPRPYSLAKAKKLNIRMRRLPLDQHLMWGMGGKSLTLNQMVRIMLDLRYSRGDWKTALKHVPMRKLSREFHPYPDQVNQSDTDASPKMEQSQPYRREKRSQVYEDYELLNRRKGYRRSDMYTPREKVEFRAPKARSLFYDD